VKAGNGGRWNNNFNKLTTAKKIGLFYLFFVFARGKHASIFRSLGECWKGDAL
jgi:hypothetical protein